MKTDEAEIAVKKTADNYRVCDGRWGRRRKKKLIIFIHQPTMTNDFVIFSPYVLPAFFESDGRREKTRQNLLNHLPGNVFLINKLQVVRSMRAQ